MRSFLEAPSDAERRARFPVRVLEAPSLGPDGVTHGPDGARELLRWAAVERVSVAEVGEPEGVRTVVCDLIGRTAGGTLRVARLDAEPGDAAIALARGLTQGLGPRRAPAALKSLAADGLASRWFPDLRAFEEDALAALERAE